MPSRYRYVAALVSRSLPTPTYKASLAADTFIRHLALKRFTEIKIDLHGSPSGHPSTKSYPLLKEGSIENSNPRFLNTSCLMGE